MVRAAELGPHSRGAVGDPRRAGCRARRSGLADRASLSPRHFQRKFTAEVGTPPGAYVERVRIEAAQRALAEGDDPVETIARQCGFGTGETLRRAFHRHTRIAPSDYRDRFRSTTYTREYA